MTRTTGQKIVARFERRFGKLFDRDRAWLVKQIDNVELEAVFRSLRVSNRAEIKLIVSENVKLKQQLAAQPQKDEP